MNDVGHEGNDVAEGDSQSILIFNVSDSDASRESLSECSGLKSTLTTSALKGSKIVWITDSAVLMVTGYGLGDRGIVVRVAVGQAFSLFHVVQTGYGAHRTSYQMDTEDSFLGVKRPRPEADHSRSASAEVKKTWLYTFTLPYFFMT
jgi:hypothetical protein